MKIDIKSMLDKKSDINHSPSENNESNNTKDSISSIDENILEIVEVEKNINGNDNEKVEEQKPMISLKFLNKKNDEKIKINKDIEDEKEKVKENIKKEELEIKTKKEEKKEELFSNYESDFNKEKIGELNKKQISKKYILKKLFLVLCIAYTVLSWTYIAINYEKIDLSKNNIDYIFKKINWESEQIWKIKFLILWKNNYLIEYKYKWWNIEYKYNDSIYLNKESIINYIKQEIEKEKLRREEEKRQKEILEAIERDNLIKQKIYENYTDKVE